MNPSPDIRNLKILAIVALALTLALLTCTNLHDLDHGFYLAVGRHMIAQHGIPQKEFYLPLLADRAFGSPWLLSALIFAVVWKVAGVAGFITLKALCYAGGFALAANAAVRRQVPVTVACFCSALVACAVANRFVERPGFFSALFYGIIIAAIPPRSTPSRKLLASLIAMFVAWPFLHAEWYIGLFLFACLIATTGTIAVEKMIVSTAAAILPCTVFSALHPAHFEPLIAPFKFIAGAGPDFKIHEYSVATWSQLLGAIPLLLALAAVAAWLAKQKRFAEAALLAALFVLSIKASRAALPALLIGVPWLAQGAAALLARMPRANVAVAVLSVVAPLCALSWLYASPHRALGFHIDPMIDTRGIGRIFDHLDKDEGAVLAEFGYTSQLLANPSIVRQGVVMDGRQEIYSEKYLQSTYLDCVFQRGEKQKAALGRARVAFYAEAWREAGDTDLFPALRAQGWEVIGWDNSGRVLARPGIASKYGLRIYSLDPANLQDLQNKKPEQIKSALNELRDRNTELETQKYPAAIPLSAQATLELATGDTSAAAESLEKSRTQGGERISSYWKSKLALATVKDDTAAMKDAVSQMKKRGFK
ncbi:MAG: hypothetical protein ABI579_05200 [Candidatus Sumerlaeota bacterium]